MISVLLLSLAPFLGTRIPLNGVTHYIRDTGEPSSSNTTHTSPNTSPIAVLLHGFTGSSDSWEDVAPLLHRAGVRAIAIDRVGFGRTDRPSPPTAPSPPKLPFGFSDAIADRLEYRSGDTVEREGLAGLFPDPLDVLATALRRPETLAPKLSWGVSQWKRDPYSSRFAVEALWPLLTAVVGDGAANGNGNGNVNVNRPVYFVGHSAGGPLALRALVESVSDSTRLPNGLYGAGCGLVAPAVLDPEEDPDAYNNDDSSSDSIPLNVRIAAFKTVLSLPDAFSMKLARRMVDNRNMTQALLNQTGSRVLSSERVEALVEKYTAPVREFSNDWDTGLLNVYRADFLREDAGLSKGRTLLSDARGVMRNANAGREDADADAYAAFCVISGEEDGVVPLRSSQRIAGLLGCECVEISQTGHLPMDETPDECAQSLLDFIQP